VLINRAAMSYAGTALSLNGAAVSIRNSTVDRVSGDGVNVTSPVAVPTISANTVTNAAAAAIVVQAASIDMGALNGNSGSLEFRDSRVDGAVVMAAAGASGGSRLRA
jgi:hypothetical protein